MDNALEIIEKAIEEHAFISQNISNVSAKLNDVNALLLLRWERSNLVASSLEMFSNKLGDLKKSVDSLKSNLGRHFKFEERSLPLVLDKSVMQSLMVEHSIINTQIDKTDILLKNVRIKGLSEKEFMDKKIEILTIVNDLCHLIQKHALKEDTLLRDRIKSLESKKDK